MIFETFLAIQEVDGLWTVYSTDVPTLVVRAYDESEAVKLREALNRAYRLGYSQGETDVQQAMRRALGLD
jgi:hypothetical protein